MCKIIPFFRITSACVKHLKINSYKTFADFADFIFNDRYKEKIKI